MNPRLASAALTGLFNDVCEACKHEKVPTKRNKCEKPWNALLDYSKSSQALQFFTVTENKCLFSQ